MANARILAESATGGNVLAALGIDWKSLILQIIAFVILVFLIAKFVVPILLRSVDARQAAIEASQKAAEEAVKAAHDAEEKAAALLREARTQASDILTTAKEEATSAIESAQAKAKLQADAIVNGAHAQIQKDVASARRTLKNDTIDLVADATEKIARIKLDAGQDAKVIEAALSSALPKETR